MNRRRRAGLLRHGRFSALDSFGEKDFAFFYFDRCLAKADEFEEGEEPPNDFGSSEFSDDDLIQSLEIFGKCFHDDHHLIAETPTGFAEDLGGIGFCPCEEFFKCFCKVKSGDFLGIEREFVICGVGVGASEKEVISFRLAVQQVINGGGEFVDIWVNVVQNVFSFGLSIGMRKEEPGFLFEQET